MSTVFMLVDATAGGSTFWRMDQVVGAYSPIYTATTTTGWTVGTTVAGKYALMAANVERAAGTFTTTIEPRTSPDNTLGDCFRTASPMSLSFPAGSWTLNFYVCASTSGGNQDGRIRWRLWKGRQPDGSDAMEITPKPVINSTLTNITVGSITANSGGTIGLPAFRLVHEFLFIQIAWEITGAGSTATRDVLFRMQAGLSRLIGPDSVNQSSTVELSWALERPVLDQWFGAVSPTVPAFWYCGITNTTLLEDGSGVADQVFPVQIPNDLLHWLDITMLGHELDNYARTLWRFDESSGTALADEKTNYNATHSSNLTRVLGVRKRAVEYDVTDYTETAVLDADHRTKMQSDVSVEMCVYLKSTLTTDCRLFTAGGAIAETGLAEDNTALMILCDSATDNGVSVGWNYGDPPGNYNTGVLGYLVKDKWQHLAVTRSSEGKVRLYINGVETDNFTIANLPNYGSNMKFRFPGLIHSTPQLGIKGYLDEVRVSTIERTAEEVLASYERCFVPSTSRAIVTNAQEIVFGPFGSSGYAFDKIFLTDSDSLGTVVAWAQILTVNTTLGQFYRIPPETLTVRLG